MLEVILFVSGFIFLILSVIIFQTNWNVINVETLSNYDERSTVEMIGYLILDEYLLPFELISILLLAALIGSAMLARKKINE